MCTCTGAKTPAAAAQMMRQAPRPRLHKPPRVPLMPQQAAAGLRSGSITAHMVCSLHKAPRGPLMAPRAAASLGSGSTTALMMCSALPPLPLVSSHPHCYACPPPNYAPRAWMRQPVTTCHRSSTHQCVQRNAKAAAVRSLLPPAILPAPARASLLRPPTAPSPAAGLPRAARSLPTPSPPMLQNYQGQERKWWIALSQAPAPQTPRALQQQGMCQPMQQLRLQPHLWWPRQQHQLPPGSLPLPQLLSQPASHLL
mmetsp:Transcript_9357/g.25225  ORF Transcript_9357/g.25225 Transcript_9357/m.25225 type:complete len:255 (-) Transcript_9357:295-1059(-)